MCSSDAASVAAKAYCSTQSRAAYSASRARGSQRRGLLPFRLLAVMLPALHHTLLPHTCVISPHVASLTAEKSCLVVKTVLNFKFIASNKICI